MIPKVICAGCLLIALFAQDPGPRVELSMIVTDKKNNSLSSIRKEDVHVFEDNIEQTILSIEKDEKPLDLGIAIDSSGSVRTFFSAVVVAAKAIIDAIRPDDQVFIERFISTDKIERVHDFSSNKVALQQAVDKLYVEGGQSAIVDAAYTAVNYVAEHNKAVPGRRKALVIITDGEDRNSYYKAEKLIELLHKHQVQVFILGFTHALKESSPPKVGSREKAEKLLKSIAEESGGRVFFPRENDEVLNATLQIIADLRGQFRITYQSSNPDPKQNFRKVEVRFTSSDGEKRTAITRPGYSVETKPSEKK